MAALPAPGSVMQIAGLSPARTSSAASRFCVSEPYRMIAPMAPRLASTTIRAVAPQDRATASMTRTASRQVRPRPPCSFGMVIPMNPAAVNASTLARG